jgi:acyl-CoA thioesterase-1
MLAAKQRLRKTNNTILWIFTAIAMSGLAWTAQADPIRIVAVGASNTSGDGVASSQAWPAQLEAMLRARGYNVTVVNNGVSGNTSAQIMARVDAVPPGTPVIIFDTGGKNDRRTNVSEDARNTSIAQIENRIRARGAKPIRSRHNTFGGSLYQNDGIHLNPAGHKQVAARLLPQVTAALGKRR